MRPTFLGLRGGVTLLVLLALLPSIAVISLSARDRRNESESRLQEQADQLANATLVSYEHWIDTTRTFLLPLANVFALIPNLEDLSDEACGPVLDQLLASDTRFLYVGGATANGEVVCGSPARGDETLNLNELDFFRRVVDSGSFALGGAAIDDVTGRPTIRAGYPIIGPTGVRGVAYVALDLDSLAAELGRTGPPGFQVALVDDTGDVYARFPQPPDWNGERLAADILADDPDDAADAIIGGNDDELLVTSVVQEEPFSGALRRVRVAAGVPSGDAFAGVDARLRNDLLALTGVAALALLVAWFGSGFLLRDLRRYVTTTQRLAEGDLDARTGPPYPRSELGALGRSFDNMAEILAERQQEVKRLNESLERRVQERTVELERANAELEAFSYSVSHDLRAPLRAIDGFSRIIQEDYSQNLEPEARRYFDSIRSNSKFMGTLIDDLLTFSRLGRRPLDRVSVPMGDLARSVAEELAAQEEHASVTVTDVPACDCDSALMRQVYANLIGNALKFTRKTEGARIEIGFDTGQNAYYVRDNGVGFDMQYAGKMFGVFQRLHRPEDFEGTGVGLAIVQRIVHRHGGRVWGESTPNESTTFYFTVGEGETSGA